MMDFSVINESGTALDAVSPAVIKVIGCGGGGSNAVNRMIDADIANVDFIVLNTDVQDLNRSKAETRIAIGRKVAKGLGAGGNPKVGEEAAEEDKEAIANLLEGTDMIFITAGMGGGTGTGSAPVVARIARSLGVLTVGVVTTPFEFEGPVRMRQAREGISRLHENVDSLIVIPNQQLLKVVDKNMPIRQAFLVADDVLRQGVEGISNIITKPGDVNRDFTDVKNTMLGQGEAILGVGHASGENRAVDAATKAIKNPLLEDTSIDGAKSVLINICSSGDISMLEVSEIMKVVRASIDPDANILWGQAIDPSLGENVSVTVIATGFHAGFERGAGDDASSSAVHDSSVVTSDEFSDILGGRGFERMRQKLSSAAETSLFDSVDSDAEKVPVAVGAPSVREQANQKIGSLGKALSASVPRYSASGIKPPAGFTGGNDISQPACWRASGRGELSRTIRLQD